jgi:drug/metabolite transporter (DMT)-like permease
VSTVATQSNRKNLRGLLALLAFALLSAARDVLTKSHIFGGTRPIDAITITFIYCTVTWLLFLLLSLTTRGGRSQLAGLRAAIDEPQKRRQLLTLLAYVTSFMAIDKTDAFVNSLADYGAAPVVTAVFALLLRKERFGRVEILGMFLSVCGISLLVGSSTGGDRASTSVGIGLAILSCVALSLANIWNKSLVDKGVRRGALIVGRLSLALLVLGLWCIATGSLAKVHWAEDGGKLALLGLLGMALPLYLVVLAFETLGVRYLALAFFLIPVFTFMGTSIVSGDLDFLGLLAGVLTLVGVVVAERAAASRQPPPQAPKPRIGTPSVDGVTTS